MDAHRETFNDWNAKNESLLQRIGQLENDIDRMQHSIDAKQTEIRQLHQEENAWTKQQQKLDAYDTIFKSNILHDINSQPSSTTATLLNQTQESAATQVQQRRRRDITEQLLTSTARVCHRIERLWTSHPTKYNGAAGTGDNNNTDNIDDNDNSNTNDNGIFLAACSSLQLDIKQLMETQSSKDYLDSLALLLQHEDEQYKHLLPSDGTSQANGQSDDKENGIPVPVAPTTTTNTATTTEDTDRLTQKLDWIEQQQKERLQHVLKMEQDASDRESRMQTLETQLDQQVKSRYSDPEVQTAFSTYVMTKVKNAQESSRLASYESYLDEMKQIASVLEEKHGNLDEIQKETVDAIKSVVHQRKNIKTIKAINQNESEVRAQKEQAAHLKESIRTLQQQLRADIQDQLVPMVLNSESNERLESSIDQIGQSLGCLPSTAPDKILENMESLLERVHLSSSHQQASVHHELETLAMSWTEELKEKGINPPEENPEQDAIDTVVESVRIIQEHVEKDWNGFVQQQQAQLLAKADTIEENRKDLESIQLLLDERNQISKGLIGNDYTAQDRNLEEWFQLLDEM